MKNTLKHIDRFVACGRLFLGLHTAGWKVIFAIGKNFDAIKTLKYNLIDNKNYFNWPKLLPQKNLNIDNIITTHNSDLQKLQDSIDLVADGPHCLGFSMASRRNEIDQINHLVTSYIKFIKLLKPKIIFFLNVKDFTMEFKNNTEKGKEYLQYIKWHKITLPTRFVLEVSFLEQSRNKACKI